MKLIKVVDSGSRPVLISKKLLRDTRLSAKGLGIICYLLSLPDGSNVTIESVLCNVNDSEKNIKDAFDELIRLGYVEEKEYGRIFIDDEPKGENR